MKLAERPTSDGGATFVRAHWFEYAGEIGPKNFERYVLSAISLVTKTRCILSSLPLSEFVMSQARELIWLKVLARSSWRKPLTL